MKPYPAIAGVPPECHAGCHNQDDQACGQSPSARTPSAQATEPSFRGTLPFSEVRGEFRFEFFEPFDFVLALHALRRVGFDFRCSIALQFSVHVSGELVIIEMFNPAWLVPEELLQSLIGYLQLFGRFHAPVALVTFENVVVDGHKFLGSTRPAAVCLQLDFRKMASHNASLN
jgi:hypothetical protein